MSRFYPVGIETELSDPPLAITLHGLAREVPDVVNISLVTLAVDLQVGNPTLFLEISETVNKQLWEGRGGY